MKFPQYILKIVFLVFLVNCKEKENQKEIQLPTSNKVLKAVSIFKYGKVKKNDVDFNLGDILLADEIVKVGEKSNCDIQVLDSNTVVRLKEKSEFKLKIVDNTFHLYLHIGTTLVNVQKRNSPDKQIIINTPAVVVAVRGTKFDLSVNKDGTTKIKLFEGKIATHLNLATENIQNEKLKEALKSYSEKQEIVIETGQKYEVSQEQVNKILPVLEKQPLETLSGQAIEESLKKVYPSIPVNEIPKQELKENLEEFIELAPIEPEKLNNPDKNIVLKSIKEKLESSAVKESLLNRMAKSSGKVKGTIILKDGNTKVTGLIEQVENKYIVDTPSGIKEYNVDDIDSVLY